jgi:hypothetical protein
MDRKNLQKRKKKTSVSSNPADFPDFGRRRPNSVTRASAPPRAVVLSGPYNTPLVVMSPNTQSFAELYVNIEGPPTSRVRTCACDIDFLSIEFRNSDGDYTITTTRALTSD